MEARNKEFQAAFAAVGVKLGGSVARWKLPVACFPFALYSRTAPTLRLTEPSQC